MINRNTALPFLCEREKAQDYLGAAEEWLSALIEIRALKSGGSLPVFPKSYHSPVATALRRSAIMLLKAAERIGPLKSLTRSAAIPDFLDLDAHAEVKIVVKSVNGLGRAALFAAAAPESRIIHILRHPCGHVGSMLRGAVLAHETELGEDIVLSLCATDQARRRNLSVARLLRLPMFEQFAWNWVIHNDKALEDLAGNNNVTRLRYEDLAEDPEPKARELFAWCGLEWHAQCSAFVAESTQGTQQEEGYFQIKRDPHEAMSKWRRELSQPQIDAILAIVADSPAGRLYLDDKSEEKARRMPRHQDA